jgi:hypothetical protein
MFLEEVLERSVRCAPKRGRTGPYRALGPMLSPEPSALDTYLTKANERGEARRSWQTEVLHGYGSTETRRALETYLPP